MKKEIFDIIHYANCWEDTEILLDALNIKNNGVYLSILSGGDNTFSLLTKNPKKVIGVDIGRAQVSVFYLKKIAIERLPYRKILEFLGILPSNERASIYRSLVQYFPDHIKEFWDNNLSIIEKGVIFSGKFEKYFLVFRKFILPLIHKEKTIEELFKEKTLKQRREFYYTKWNSPRWKMMFKVFFSKFVMGHLGRDPEFFRYVDVPVAENIKKVVELGLINIPAWENPYVDFILHKNFTLTLPYYLRKENLRIIKKNIDRIEVVEGPVEKGLEKARKFDGFNLSDIFEYMDYNTFSGLYAKIIEKSKRGTRLLYWNMLADRNCPENLKDKVKSLTDLSSKLYKKNKSFFYQTLIIEGRK